MTDKTCVDCPAVATTVFSEWRGDWGIAEIPVCAEHVETRRATAAGPRPFGAGF